MAAVASSNVHAEPPPAAPDAAGPPPPAAPDAAGPPPPASVAVASAQAGAYAVRAGADNAGSTRERILDIAQTLFIEQGYDKTSLREIAERLGTTKAALYYHFERKEDILLALHLRLHELGREAFDRLEEVEDGPAQAEAWVQLLDAFTTQVLENQDLFVLHQRNQNALKSLEHNERHQQENEDMMERMRRLLTGPGLSLELRVRVVCAISTIMGGMIRSSELLSDVPISELARIVRDTVHDMLEPGRSA